MNAQVISSTLQLVPPSDVKRTLAGPTDTDKHDGDFNVWSLAKHHLAPVFELLNDPTISEIKVSRWDKIFVEKSGKNIPVDWVHFDNEYQLAKGIESLGTALGQPVHAVNHPILDARLLDGSRVSATLAPTAANGSAMTVRVFKKERLTVQQLVKFGAITEEMLEYLRVAVLVRASGLVSGGTNSGKTTLLNALSSMIPRVDRVLCAEDTRELSIDVDEVEYYEAPHRLHVQGSQEVTLAVLIKSFLRKTPDRAFVGEIRDGQAATAFMQLINTGHEGCWSTVHANDPPRALRRIASLVASVSAGLPYDFVYEEVAGNLDLIIQAKKTPQHGRRVVLVSECREGKAVPVFHFDYIRGIHLCDRAALRESTILRRAEEYGIKHTLLDGPEV